METKQPSECSKQDCKVTKDNWRIYEIEGKDVRYCHEHYIEYLNEKGIQILILDLKERSSDNIVWVDVIKKVPIYIKSSFNFERNIKKRKNDTFLYSSIKKLDPEKVNNDNGYILEISNNEITEICLENGVVTHKDFVPELEREEYKKIFICKEDEIKNIYTETEFDVFKKYNTYAIINIEEAFKYKKRRIEKKEEGDEKEEGNKKKEEKKEITDEDVKKLLKENINQLNDSDVYYVDDEESDKSYESDISLGNKLISSSEDEK